MKRSIMGGIFILFILNQTGFFQESHGVCLRRMRSNSFLYSISTQLITLKAQLNNVIRRGYLGEEVNEEKEAVNKRLREFFLNDEYYDFILEGLKQASTDTEKRSFRILKLYFDFQRISLEPEIVHLQEEISHRYSAAMKVLDEEFPKLGDRTPENYQGIERLYKQLGKETEPLMRRLIELRNQKAQESGYQGWIDLKFKLSEIDRAKFESLLNALKASKLLDLKRMIVERVKEQTGMETIPGSVFVPEYNLIRSYSEKMSEGMIVESTLEFLKTIGITIPQGEDSPIEIIRTKNFRFAGYDFLMQTGKEGKSILVFNLGLAGYLPGTPLHEIGHALHDYSISDSLPPELRRWEGMYSAYSESMAEMLRFFMYDKEWLKEFFLITDENNSDGIRHLDNKEAEELLKAFKMVTIIQMTNYMRDYELEREMYKNPEQDYDLLLGRINKEYQTEDYYPGFSWSRFIPFLASADESMYYQNYMLSFLVAAQVHAAIKDKFGVSFGNEEIGNFLTEGLYQFGMSRPWMEVISEATGKELSVDDFIKRFVTPYIAPQ